MSVDCDNYNYACRGGDFTLAWKYMENRGGAMKTSVYPYVSGTTKTVNHFEFFHV
jgi:cathepsin L